MNKTKYLYTIILSLMFTGNIITMKQQESMVIQESSLLSLPNELVVNILNQAILPKVKVAINDSYNNIFNKPKTIKVNLEEFKGLRDSSLYLYDLVNNHLKSNTFKNIIKDLKQKRFDELKEKIQEEYQGQPTEDLNQDLANILNQNLWEPYEISKEDLKTVVKLILAGANVNAANNYGQTALIYASWKGYKDIVEILINASADIHAINRWGTNALINAVLKGHKEIVQILIEAGTDVNAKDNNVRTALIYASEKGHKDIVEILIKANADINAKDKDGKTALMCTCINNNFKIIKMLIQAKASINLKDNVGNTALTIMIRKISNINITPRNFIIIILSAWTLYSFFTR